MLKTFIFGAILGALAAAGAVYSVPVVDQYREVSVVSVAPNGGNHETFAINIPEDRVLLGAPGSASGVPDGLEWPNNDMLGGLTTEFFKVRNVRDAVIGVAARNRVREAGADVTEWVIHLPARGTLFVNLDRESRNGGRVGDLRAGTREFGDIAGAIAEQWVPAESSDQGESTGRIELQANYISTTADAAPISVEAAQ